MPCSGREGLSCCGDAIFRSCEVRNFSPLLREWANHETNPAANPMPFIHWVMFYPHNVFPALLWQGSPRRRPLVGLRALNFGSDPFVPVPTQWQIHSRFRSREKKESNVVLKKCAARRALLRG